MYTDKYKFSLIVSNDDYIVRDHRLHGVRAVPGVTFLDILFRFAKMKGFNPSNVEIKNLLFMQPVVTAEEYDKRVFIVMKQDANSDYWNFTITSQKYKDGKILDEEVYTNAKGEMHLCEEQLKNRIDIKSLKKHADKVYDMDKAYEYSRRGDLCHYEFMKVLGDVYVSKEYLLGELHLSELAEQYLDSFYLHPAYLDGCLSVTAILVSENPNIDMDNAKPFIPIYVKSFTANSEFQKKVYVYIKMDEISVSETEDIMYMNLELYDEFGKQIAFYNRFAAKRVRNDNIKKLRDERLYPSYNNLDKQVKDSEKQDEKKDSRIDLRDYIEEELCRMIATEIEQEPAAIDRNTSFYDLGLESTQLMKLVSELEKKYTITLYPTLLFEYDTISKLGEYLEVEQKEAYQNIYIKDQIKEEGKSNKKYEYVETKSIVENKLIETIALYRQLEKEEIEKDKNFYEMGLDSTSLLELAKQIEEKFNITLYPTIMFELDTISKLAGYFAKEYEEEVLQVDEPKETNKVYESASEAFVEENNNIDFCYMTEWEETPIMKHKAKASQDMLIIYTKESAPLVKSMGKYHKDKKVYQIELGNKTRKVSDQKNIINISDKGSLQKYIENIRDITDIYLVTISNYTQSEQTELDEIMVSENQGVITLFRLIKEITNMNKQSEVNTIKIITNNVFKIDENERIIPKYAGISGFYKSMVKEYPNIQMNYFDLNINDIELGYDHIVEKILKPMEHEPQDKAGYEVVLRNGKRYVKKLKYINLPEVERLPFRERGTYIILGGAGGIGTELAIYMAKNAHANVALLGRSQYNDKLKEKINQINSAGGKAIYVQVDVTEKEQIVAAVKKVNDTFGEIYGAIHSAIVLKDQTIAVMQEDILKQVLAPKVNGSVAFYHAVKEQPLDFMLFFSSAQSYIGNIGQANYAAACTFKDSYAKYIEDKEKFKVRVINWGYWGSVGVVATKEHNKKLEKVGAKSIEPVEGMETIVRVLGNNLTDVIAMKVEDYVLNNIGVEKTEEGKLYPISIPSVETEVLADIKKELQEIEIEANEESFDDFVKFGRAMLLYKFQKTGVFLKEGESYSFLDLEYRLDIDPEYKRMFHALLTIMESAGFIEVKGKNIRVTSKVEQTDITEYVNNIKDIKDELMAVRPDIDAHINLIWVCVNSYDKILTGKENYLSVMFPKGSMELVEKIYRGNKITDYFNQLVARVTKAYVKHRLTSDRTKKVNILELGAGTGGTSIFVLKDLQPYAQDISYMYTDKSMQFCLDSARQFRDQYSFLQYQSLDIEENVLTQQYKEGEYDFIFASNVLHATQSIETTLMNVKKLLKTNGMIVINEATKFQDFTTLTFGITNGWWRFTDEEIRIKGSPLLNIDSWRKVLSKVGFVNIRFLVLPKQEEEKSGQHVIIAESDGYNRKKISKSIQSIDAYSEGVEDSPIEMINVYENCDDEKFINFWKDYKENENQTMKAEKIDFIKTFGQLKKNEIIHMLVRVEANSRLEVVVAGKGKPVLLINGFGFTALQWKEQYKYLTDEFMLININYPGIGLSEDIEDFTYEGISNKFMKVLDLLEVKAPIIVVGSSWGGIIAQTIAKEHMDRVKKVILSGAFLEFKQDGGETLRERLKKDFFNLEAYEKYNILQLSECSNMNIIPKYSIYTKENFSTACISPFVKVPTTIIMGAEDQVIDKGQGKQLLELIPNAEFYEIEKAGHVPNLTNYKKYNEIISKIC